MEIKYFRSLWEYTTTPLFEAMEKIKNSGFDGVEIYMPTLEEPAEKVVAQAESIGLSIITQVATEGNTPENHLQSLEHYVEKSVALNPLLINSHTGRDFFPLEKNLEILRRSEELSKKHGIPILHETHRSRALYSTPPAREIFEEIPELKINADFSHWCNVHETLLEDQSEFMKESVKHAFHIHGRVGHPEGPQVNDPRAPEWREAVEAHLKWWEMIVQARKRDGLASFTITPEFGPAPYVPEKPYSREPLADIIEINYYMKELISNRIKPYL